MSKLVITGGRRLEGTVRIGGRKNAAIAVLPAAVLATGPSVLENIPDIDDVRTYGEILRQMGADIHRGPEGLVVDPTGFAAVVPQQELVKRLRASYYLVGVLLARFGRAQVPLPGGDEIGLRPIDQHLKGLRALGAEVVIEGGCIRATASQLKGAPIYLDVVSVGATINIMLAASMARGTTVIENAAKESHIVDLANFLNAMGADVRGAGTDAIKIHGVDSLHGCTHAIIPDDIEAATYMIAAAATGGDVLVANVIPKHLDPITAKLREAGVDVQEDGDCLRVRATGRLRAVDIKTLPYPGFPTDAQPPMTTLLSLAAGTSLVTESIWEGRFKHVEELNQMGTAIRVEGRTAIIEGVERLSGAVVRAKDLRAGAALIIAGLAADGVTEVSEVEHVYRGYERIDEKLRGLGARVERVHA